MTYRIPTGGGGETVGVATRVASGGDIVEGRSSSGVEEGVEETERLLPDGDTSVVQESDD